MGGLLAVGFYWGREVDQNERKRGTPPWWSGFVMTKWSTDSVLDLVFPIVACAAFCCVSYFLEFYSVL